MPTVNMNEAQSRLSLLVEDALAGKEVIIAKSGEPLVKLVPVHKTKHLRRPGRYKGQISIADDFDNTPDFIISAFEGQEP